MIIRCSGVREVTWDPRARRVQAVIDVDVPPDFPSPPSSGIAEHVAWQKKVLDFIQDGSEKAEPEEGKTRWDHIRDNAT